MNRYLVAGLIAIFMLVLSPAAGRSNPDHEEMIERASVAVQRVPVAPGLRDEAAMVLVGTGLLVLAAAVRRST